MENNGDWKGAGRSGLMRMIGASNHSETDRVQRDYYATDPKALETLLKYETFAHNVWEPCCGEGHLSNVMKQRGHEVKESDIVDRIGNEIIDFLTFPPKFDGDIITNPPYAMAKECVESAMSCIPEGNKVAMFLKLTFLEGKARKALFRTYPPKRIYVFSERQKCAPNGDFSKVGSSAVCYAWFVWEKGFKGDPIVKWI